MDIGEIERIWEVEPLVEPAEVPSSEPATPGRTREAAK